MTHWILIRHGATDWNRDGRYQGQADPPLNAQGRAQAEHLARTLAGRPIQAVFSSDLQRALRTAEALAASHALRVIIDKRLREINQGRWEGMLVDDIAASFPTEWGVIQQDPLRARAPGGESVDDVARRAMACVREIAARFPRGPVVIVSHGLTLACLLCSMHGFPLEQAREHIPPNGVPVELVSGPEPGVQRA